jgi:class 3 adenylate cyclase/tetratricopeptide (TPR) repeat protein
MIRCPNCGEENPERARFCLTCGKALAESTSAPSASRKTVTIVFADVTGSTALGERLDPESLRQLMSRYFEAARQVIERHGGTVEKFIGDAVMAVFGIPVLHEDDALRAVRAAADLRDAVVTLSADLVQERGVEFAVRIGVNTGEVVVGDPGSSQTLVTGDPVNVAARLEQAASPGEILLGGPTHRLVRDAVTVEPITALSLKGKSDAVPAFRLVTVDAEAAGHARRLDAPLIGRQRELTLLTQAFERAIEENAAHLFTLLGPPGVGKSRLVNEFLMTQRERATVYEGRCLPYGDGITYWPMRDVVRQAAQIADADAPEAAIAKIRRLTSGHERADRITEQIAGAIGLGEAAGTPEEVAWAFRKLMEVRAAESPLILVMDDIQWAEPTFLDVLEHIADWSRAAPIVLLCLARGDLLDLRPSWGGGKLNATTILLEPLSTDQSRQLVDALLGHAGIGPELADRVATAAEGNPLFVEELIAMLVDDGMIQRTDDGWTVAGDLSALLVPPTVSALLAARLDRLSDPERDVIGRAAVVGKVFEEAAVAELSAASVRPGVQRNLLTLVRKELIRPDQSSPDDDVYRFRHLLIRDAAYASLSKEVRAELHVRFADWLVSAAGERGGEYDEIVAYHLEQAYLYRAELSPSDSATATLRARAGTLLAEAGTRASARYDVAAARGLLVRATRVLDRDDPLQIGCLIRLAEIAGDVGTIEEGIDAAKRARQLAGEYGDEVGAIRAGLEIEAITSHIDPSYNWDRYRAILDDAQPVLEREGDHEGLVRLWLMHAEVENVYGQWAADAAACRRAMEHAERAGRPDLARRAEPPMMMASYLGPLPLERLAEDAMRWIARGDGLPVTEGGWTWVGVVQALSGSTEEGFANIRRGRAAGRDLGLVIPLAGSRTLEADVYTAVGDLASAADELRTGASVLRQSGESAVLSTVTGYLSVVLAEIGEFKEAEEAAAESRSPATADDIVSQLLWREGLAVVRARQGEHTEAERLGRQAVKLSQRTDSPTFQAMAASALATVLAAGGHREQAMTAHREAIQLYERKGNHTMAARLRREGPVVSAQPSSARASRQD